MHQNNLSSAKNHTNLLKLKASYSGQCKLFALPLLLDKEKKQQRRGNRESV